MNKKPRRNFIVRDDGELFELLERRLELERQRTPGRRHTREGLVREILYGSLRTTLRPRLGS